MNFAEKTRGRTGDLGENPDEGGPSYTGEKGGVEGIAGCDPVFEIGEVERGGGVRGEAFDGGEERVGDMVRVEELQHHPVLVWREGEWVRRRRRRESK